MPNGYDASAFPVSYKDPAYDEADQAAAQANGIPAEWLSNIRTKGEKSNADQISSAQAATPYQITPDTRQAILKQTGVDPYLNPQTAAYGAAYLLKQNLGRYGGNAVLATAAYHGGTDQSQWGPKTMAYAKRVTGASPNNSDATPSFGNPSSGYQVQPLPNIGAAPGSLPGSAPQSSFSPSSSNPYAVASLPNIGSAPGALDSGSNGPSPLARIYDAYKSGQMSPEDKAAFEQDVNSGRIVLPSGMSVNPPAPQAPIAPQQLVSAFNSGLMSPEDAAQLQKDVQSGAITLPPGANLTPPQPPTAGREAGVAARGYVQGLTDTVGGLVDKAKGVIDMPMHALNSMMQGGGAANAIDQLFGTHIAPQPAPSLSSLITGQPNTPLAGAPQAAPNIPGLGETATEVMNRAGLPTAQTPGERVLQAGAQGAGALTVPVPGMALKAVPAMIAAGAAGGTVGEAVHQATGNPWLGMAANLLTTALSPAVASRVMSAIAKELPQTAAAGAERIEPTMQGAPAAAAPEPAPAAAASPSTPPPNLATTLNPGAPQVPNPSIAMLEREREGLLSAAANAPQKGDTSVQDQITSLEGRSFDSVADRTKMLQQQGMKFGDARALAQKQLASEMSGYQDQMGRLQAAQAQQAEGSRALQRVQEIDQQLASMPRTVPAQQNPMAAAARGAMETPAPAAAAQAPEAVASAAPEAAASMTPQGAADEAAGGAAVNPASPREQALVPDDQDARREIIGLMQRASGRDRTISADDVQAAQQQLLSRFKIDPQAVADARDLGVLDNLQPDHLATDLQMIKLNQLLKSDPSNPMAAKEAEGLTRVGQRAVDLFNEMGASPDISALSQKVNSFLAEQHQSLKSDVGDILDKQIPSMVPRTAQVPATNALGMINQELENLGGRSGLLSRDWRRAQNLLTPQDEAVTINGEKVAGSKVGVPPTNPTYHTIDTLRKQLNAADKGAGPFVSMEQASRRRLAQALSQDQGNYLKAQSPEAYNLWQQANAKTQLYKAVQDDMKTLFGNAAERSMLPVLKNAIQGLQSGNVEGFTKVVKAIPKSMRNEALTTALQNLFTKTGSAETGSFGFQQLSNFGKAFKQDSASWNALMGNLEPEARANFSKLLNVSTSIANSVSQKIYTGRSRFAKDLTTELNNVPETTIDRLRSAAGPAVGHAMGSAAAAAAHHVPVVGPVVAPIARGIGHVAASIITPSKTPVEKALSDFMLSDEAKGMIENGPKATPEQIKQAANSSTFKLFYDFARSATAANDPASRERWLLGIVNAAEPAANSNRNR